ncbi:uncharacterized membrane-anchored protein YitT (DUF2179 family) [Herbinix hemicellulosilytica]|uniref:Putative membrane protein n=1 Tax=Herbinix hemicellulosilytica TaxID=1564487 RepID=A0A0H5SFF1_HERHM|nr:YitT family protein [Herbinix hemicellulosilytica]RBP60322.1 uncharacterized membrane-anchored protein YitT (DUF2179 family) [Herbinix hemicellulosilytica]CRZ33536.1 putative membrane protein [Herbinix hemicellulosilytica]
MKEQNKKTDILKEYFLITIGALMVTVGVHYFKFPNNFSIGGITGAGILLSSILGGKISSGTIVLIINTILLVLGYIVFGRDFGVKTAYGSFILSVGLKLLEIISPMDRPFTNEPVIELFFAVVLPGVGAAILFNLGSSTGGTDIIAMILKKKTNVNIGQALLATDFILTLLTFPIFGMLTGLLSLAGLIIKSIVVDNIVEALNLCKYFTVICDDADDICSFIIKSLNRSATVYDAKGAFTDHKKKIILTVMTRSQAVQLQHYIKKNHPDAFILITNTSEIIGRGFRGYL